MISNRRPRPVASVSGLENPSDRKRHLLTGPSPRITSRKIEAMAVSFGKGQTVSENDESLEEKVLTIDRIGKIPFTYIFLLA